MQHLRRTLRATALGLGLALVLTACGQKPGVHVAGSGQAGGAEAGGGDGAAAGATGDGGTGGGDGSVDVGDSGGTGSDGTSSGSDGGSAVGGTGGGSDSGGTTGGSSGGGSTGGGDQGTTGEGSNGGGSGGGDQGTTGGSSGGQQQVQGSDTTGAGPDTITVGVHAPVTGAAPLPAQSFKEARDLYWRWLIEEQGQTVLGRTNVEVVFRDDKYNPNSAIQVCREMAQEAFLLVGGGGTDQIQACGRFSGQAQVPYFSAGVTEAGLRGNPWYFATSMSYKAQGRLLAQQINNEFPDAKVAMIVTDTANFQDAVDGWMEGVEQQNIDYFKTLKHPKGDTSWYTQFAQELSDAGVDVIYPLTAPVDYIRFAQQASEQGYNPHYRGVGVTQGINAVLSGGCPDTPDTGIDNAKFFSPFPGIDWAEQNERDFFQAAERFGTVSDDLGFALWGLAKAQHVLFERYGETFGNELTREDFRAFTEVQENVENGIFPSVTYSPDDHFGADTVHLLEADCTKGQYVTRATFASSF